MKKKKKKESQIEFPIWPLTLQKKYTLDENINYLITKFIFALRNF